MTERKVTKMKKMLPILMALCLAAGLLSGCGGTPANQPDTSGNSSNSGNSSDEAPTGPKTMVIGDTTFNSENWEETVDPHRTYNGWACIRYGVGETLVHYTDTMEYLAGQCDLLQRPENGRRSCQTVSGSSAGGP